MNTQKMSFDKHVDKKTALAMVRSFRDEHLDQMQNVTVNYYEQSEKPYYITFGHYQSGADRTCSGRVFLKVRKVPEESYYSNH